MNYRGAMRDFVIEISRYAKNKKRGFIIIPQNAPQLLTNERYRALPDRKYISAIDGIGIESLNFSHNDGRVSRDTYIDKTNYLEKAAQFGKKILITEYARRKRNIKKSGRMNKLYKYVTFFAPSRELDLLPSRKNVSFNRKDIKKLGDVENFLYLINTQNFKNKAEFLRKLSSTDYDLFIIDCAFEGEFLSRGDVKKLKRKKNGKKRLVICYMSIGEAENYRFYWKKRWNKKRPGWIESENPNWPGNFVVRFWYRTWKNIIFGSKDSYLDKIIGAGFDGVYLDTIDSWEYFQK
jgi:cysteinyl-tRNA synthetase